MRDDNAANITGALTGAAGALIWGFIENENAKDRRIADLRDDQRDLQSRLNDFLLSGDWGRLRYPTVRDVLTGVAVSSPTTPAPSTVPPIGAATPRPDLTSGSNVPSMTWPPQVGTYDSTGRAAQPGELATAGLVSTYPEPRAWEQGLTQKTAPTGAQLTQLFYAANALAFTITGQALSWAQWQAIWQRLITGGTGGAPQPAVNPHCDPSKAPTIVGSLATGIATVAPLTTPIVSGYPYANPNTDSAMRFRLVTNSASGIIGAGTALFTVKFGAEYRYQGIPFQPVVVTNRPDRVYIDGISSTQFTVYSWQALSMGGAAYDFYISTSSGVASDA